VSLLGALLSAGFFVAVPLTGRAVMGRLGPAIPAIARPSVWVAAGVAIWSVPLLGSLALGIYHPDILGAAGWLTAAGLIGIKLRHGFSRPRLPALSNADRFALAAIVLAGLLTAAFPADPITSPRDMGIYSSDAIYMADHGRLDVPYPWPAGQPVPPGFVDNGQLFATQPTLTVRFSNLWPAWLAQTYAATGYEGMIRLNALVGILPLLVVYALAKGLAGGGIAAFGIALLAFNPGQMWVARQTLSEISIELLIWCGLLLLVAYLARGRPRLGLWAGILLGLSVLMHIDALLVASFLIAGHATWRVLRRRADMTAPRWGYVYLGLVPLVFLALAYYVILNRPYIDELQGNLLLVGALLAAAVAFLALTFVPVLVHLARAMLARRELVLGILTVLAVVTAYDYFLRPILPPFATFPEPIRPDLPGAPFGGRTFQEDALLNLGRYLTPGVILGALVGWSVAFYVAVRRRRAMVAFVPFLVVALGCTVAYGWNQAVFPVHFWAIRRFVPVIIVFAGLAVLFALRRLSPGGRRLAVGTVAPLVVLYTAWIGGPMYTVAEHQGSFAALSNVAAELPTNREIVALDSSYEFWRYWRPLYLAFDRPIMPIDPASDAGRAAAIALLRSASAHDPLLIITANYDDRMDTVLGSRVFTDQWSTSAMAETVSPVSRVVVPDSSSITLIAATGINTVGVRFGGAPQWAAAANGFHPVQVIDGQTMRWTNGDASLSIPIEGAAAPDHITISIADTGPNGGPLRILLNGSVLFDGNVAPGPWSAEYDINQRPDLRLGDTANVEIVSDTFEGAPVDQFDHQTQFGVLLDSVMLLGSGG
jgi:hypothetical protein